MRRLTLLSLALFLCAAVQADEAMRMEPDQGRYAKNGLFLWVALAEDAQGFLREWAQPSQPNTPVIKTRTSFHRGEIVFPAIMFSTDGLTPEGKADITYRFVFQRPDGSVYEDMTGVVINGTPAKGIGIFKDMAGLKIEDTDPFGVYTLNVTITDRVKNVSVDMPFAFTVTDKDVKQTTSLTPSLPKSEAEKPAESVMEIPSSPSGKARVRSQSSETP
ncbi:MAG: hypothetical protein ACOYNN_06490 [Terrimicrobiaceae bacterium]